MSVNQLNLIMGAGINRKEDREENDFYATDPKALELLLDKLKEDGIELSNNIWETACVDSETEFYNGFEWKKISDYVLGDKVLCYNKNGEGLLKHPLGYIKKYINDDVYEWNSKSLSMCLTKDHKVIYKQRRTGILKYDTMENIISRYNSGSNGFRGKIPTSFLIDGNIELNEWYLRLAVACNADGRIRTKYKKTYQIRVKKDRKKERLLYLLNQSGLPYKIHQAPSDNGLLNITFESPYGCKLFPKEWLFLTKKCKDTLIDELQYWDGCYENKYIDYCTSKKQDADFIQLLCASVGRHCSIYIDSRLNNNSYRLNIGNVVNFALPKDNEQHLDCKHFRGYVYCFTVESGMLILRRNNKIFITGNCGKGHLSEVLNKRGYSAFNTDLINRGYENQHLAKDFFEFDNEWNGDIITNPPYKLATQFVNHSLKLVKDGRYVIMFLPIQFLESQKRYDDLFKMTPPKYIYVFVKRVDTAMNGDFTKYKKCGPTRCYAWFIWQKGFNGEPTLRWLNNV